MVHVGLAVASLCTDWSRTIVHFEEEDGSFVHPKDETLYPSDFWVNVDNFHDSGAMPLAVLLVMTGVGQPILKMISMVFLSKGGESCAMLMIMIDHDHDDDDEKRQLLFCDA